MRSRALCGAQSVSTATRAACTLIGDCRAEVDMELGVCLLCGINLSVIALVYMFVCL